MQQEIRKHISNMTTQEKSFLNSFLTYDKYIIGKHALKREKEKVITRDSVFRAITNGSIVEYHFKDSNRLLVRGNVDEGKYNVCAVIDLDTYEIITVYDNEISDKHFTLDRSLYRKNFDIVSMFKKKKCGNNGCFGNKSNTYNNTKLVFN